MVPEWRGLLGRVMVLLGTCGHGAMVSLSTTVMETPVSDYVSD